jgi:hypothetical protein
MAHATTRQGFVPGSSRCTDLLQLAGGGLVGFRSTSLDCAKGSALPLTSFMSFHAGCGSWGPRKRSCTFSEHAPALLPPRWTPGLARRQGQRPWRPKHRGYPTALSTARRRGASRPKRWLNPVWVASPTFASTAVPTILLPCQQDAKKKTWIFYIFDG